MPNVTKPTWPTLAAAFAECCCQFNYPTRITIVQLRNCALIVLQLAQQAPRVVPLLLSPPLSLSLGMASAYARIFGNVESPRLG